MYRSSAQVPARTLISGHTGGWVLLLGLLLIPIPGWPVDFKILSANAHLQEGVFRLNAQVDWQLSQPPLEALQNGVPLTFKLRLEVLHRRPWLWDEDIAGLNQRFRLEYHALSRQYVVSNLNSGEFKSFPNRSAAIDFMGHIKDFPLLDKSLLQAGESYYVRLQARLDVDALPAPLRPVAYLSGDWRLNSEWFICPL